MYARRFRSCFAGLCALLIVFINLSGCGSNEAPDAGERVLIRVGGSTVTIREFHEAFEGGNTTPSVLYGDTEARRNAKYRTLNQLAEELILLERAKELGIQVSDEELALTVNNFKKDFPDNTFEETLIENGISYLFWEKGLKRRLLMEKVIQKDISKDAFPVPLPFENSPDEKIPENADETTVEILNDAAQETEIDANPTPAASENRAESEYNLWLDRLKEQYAIEIDWKLWEKIEQEDADGA